MADSPIIVTLKGDKDIVAAFRDLRDYLPNTALRTAVRLAAQLLAQFIALVAPKLTGRLVRNIVVRTHATAKTIRARVTVNTQGKRGDDSNAFYWRFLEEGFHTRKGDFKQYPFVAGVFDSKSREAAQEVIDACGLAIDRAAAKAKRAA